MDNRIRYIYTLFNPIGMRLNQHRDCTRVKRHAAIHISQTKESIYIARYSSDGNIHSVANVDESWRQSWLHNPRNVIEWKSDIPNFIPKAITVKSD